jgi:hypothetical protein
MNSMHFPSLHSHKCYNEMHLFCHHISIIDLVWKRNQIDRRVNRAKNMNPNMEHLENCCKRRRRNESIRRADPEYRNVEQAADTEQRCNRQTDLEYRIQEQSYGTVRRLNACTSSDDPVHRNLEQAANTEQRCNRCMDLEYRIQEQSYDTARRLYARTNSEMREEENGQRHHGHMDPEYSLQEQSVDTDCQRLAREQPGVQENKALQQRSADSNRIYDMATKLDISSGEFIFIQLCGLWNEDCRHGCGYIHLSSSTIETRKKTLRG